jgi:hypothetical protein
MLVNAILHQEVSNKDKNQAKICDGILRGSVLGAGSVNGKREGWAGRV